MVKLGEVVKTMEVYPFANVLPLEMASKVKLDSKNKDLDELKTHKRT
jgi:hypothetical protein